MNTIYELTDRYKQLYEMLGDPEYTDNHEAIHETLAACDDEFEEKADNIAKVIRQLEADAAAAEKEAARVKIRQSAYENNAKGLKLYLEQVMREIGKLKFKTPLHTFYIGKNPPGVVDHDPAKIPAMYYTPQEPKLNRALILEELKKGVEIPGAALKQSESLKIR